MLGKQFLEKHDSQQNASDVSIAQSSVMMTV